MQVARRPSSSRVAPPVPRSTYSSAHRRQSDPAVSVELRAPLHPARVHPLRPRKGVPDGKQSRTSPGCRQHHADSTSSYAGGKSVGSSSRWRRTHARWTCSPCHTSSCPRRAADPPLVKRAGCADCKASSSIRCCCDPPPICPRNLRMRCGRRRRRRRRQVLFVAREWD